MLPITGKRLQRYGLIHAAHEFILTALPFRHGESRRALARFEDVARRCELPTAESDAVLITLLAVLDPHAHGRLPSLVDRYLAQRRHVPDAVQRFCMCVDDVIRYRGVGSMEVQQAIAAIEERFVDSRLTQSALAAELGISAQQLSSLFADQTGVSFAEYLRDVRLDRAARLLVSGQASVKEIWSAVGYNDASNFCHQFRDRFATTPRDYRARGIRSAISADTFTHSVFDPISQHLGRGESLLIVDDDEGTRETLGWHLRASGYSVVVADTGEAALKQSDRGALDAIILDHHLPDMDGLQFLERLRRRDGENTPAVLLFTADWDVAEEAEHIAGFGAMFASKLCDLEEVERLVASLLAARSELAKLG
jgi:AraC-like DNA-binding protein/CheY-like chemotaxis protein